MAMFSVFLLHGVADLMQLNQCSFDLVYWVLSKLFVFPDTTLELEALVGDLEDEVFFAVNHPNRNIFSAKRSITVVTTLSLFLTYYVWMCAAMVEKYGWVSKKYVDIY